MTEANSTRLAAMMAALLAVLCAVTFWPGAFYIRLHEGDTLHLIDILLRMDAGQRPHLDFMTPIGALSFVPIMVFVKAGWGIGQSILAAQFLVALALAPALWWTARSRYPGVWAYLFAGVVLVMTVGLMFGGTDASVSISMHYNRWAWALLFMLASLVVLPPLGAAHPWAEGVVLGLGAAALLLLKATFFAGLALPLLLILLIQRDWTRLGAALLAGLVVAAVVTLWVGVDFWLAYLRDLATVAFGDIRPKPGVSYADSVSLPEYLGGALLVLAAVVILRRSGLQQAGLALLLLFPGLTFISWQNWGNEQKWVWLLALLLMVFKDMLPVPDPEKVEDEAAQKQYTSRRYSLIITSVMAMALSFGPVLNIFLSPFRHAAADKSKYVAMVPNNPHLADLLTFDVRAYQVNGSRMLAMPGAPDARWNDAELRPKPAILNGEELASCETTLGITGWTTAVAQDLAAAGYGAGTQVFSTDLFSAFWMFGPQDVLQGGAPWYYGGLTGLQNADIVLVPLCPQHEAARKQILDEMEEVGVILTEQMRTEHYIVLTAVLP